MIRTRALVARGDGSRPRVIDVDLRPPGEREVLVEIIAAAVCRTELLTIDRRSADPDAAPGPPTILGHAAVGVVSAVGGDVERVRPGQPVIVTGTRQCGRCFFCTHGAPGACDEIFRYMTREIGTAADGEEIFSDGGIGTHAERMVFPESNVVPIRGGADPRHLAMLGCGIPSGAGAVSEVAKVRSGESVAVSGCGHVGLWMIQAARAAGAGTIIAIDPDPARRDIALGMGATHVLDPGDAVVQHVRALTEGRGVDVGLEAAGTTAAMEQSFEMTRYGGRVVPTGLESEVARVSLNNLQYSLGSRTITGAQCGGGDVLSLVPRLERMLEDGILDARSILTAERSLEDAAEVYDLLALPAHLTGVLMMRGGGQGRATH